jgi:hypothetical protein
MPRISLAPALWAQRQKPAIATAQIGDALAGHIGKKGLERGPFGHAGEANSRTLELAITREEIPIVVDILGHGPLVIEPR